MTTKITWTHVDAHVRKNCEQAGVLELGATDAEVAYNYLKYKESQAALYQGKVEKLHGERDQLKVQVTQLTRQLEERAAKGKTKRRLDALEKAMRQLQQSKEWASATSDYAHGRCQYFQCEDSAVEGFTRCVNHV